MSIFKSLGDFRKKTISNLSKIIYGRDDIFSNEIDTEAGTSADSKTAVEYLKSPEHRVQAYDQYDQMSGDPVVSNALDTYADDAFGIKLGGDDDIWAIADNDKVAEEANEFLKDMKIPERSRNIAYNTVKFGDDFIRLDIEDKEGIIGIDYDIHPSLFERWEKNGKLSGFYFSEKPLNNIRRYGSTAKFNRRDAEDLTPPWEAIHFRSGIGEQRKRLTHKDALYEGIYGKSILSDILMDWKKLNIMENSMVLSRHSKSRRPMFVYIDVTGYSKEEKKKYFSTMKQKIRNHIEFSPSNNNFEKQGKINSKSEVVILAVDEGRGKVEFQDMSEDTSVESIVDVEYIRDKVYAGFAIPSAFLGLEDKLPSGIGESSLISMSTRYARTVRRVQAEVLSGIKRLVRIHLALKGMVVGSNEIDIRSQSVTTAEDLTRAETAGKVVQSFQSLLNLFGRGPLQDVDINQYDVAEFIVNQLSYPGFDPEILLSKKKAESVEKDVLEKTYEFFSSRAYLVTAEDDRADLPRSSKDDSLESNLEKWRRNVA